MRWLWILTIVLLAGCATVRPWERGDLVAPCMDAIDPLEAAANHHVTTTREGIRGASGGGGASCGCN